MRNLRRFFMGKPAVTLGLCFVLSLSLTAPAAADSWFSSFWGSKKKDAEQEAPIFVPQDTRSNKRHAPTTWHGQQAVPDTTKAITEQKSRTLRQMTRGVRNSGSYAEQLQAMTRQGYDPLNMSFVGPQARTAQDIQTTALAHSMSKLERARRLKEGTALSASNRALEVQNAQADLHTPRDIPSEADFIPLMTKQALHHESVISSRPSTLNNAASPNLKQDARQR